MLLVAQFFLRICSTFPSIAIAQSLKRGVKANSTIGILNQTVKHANEEAKPETYTLLYRVARWVTDNIKDISAFSDNGKATYAHLPDEQLWIQHAFHYLPGVVDLLSGPYHHQYFIKTPQDRCARASLVLLPKEKNKPKEVCRDGTIEIGIDTNNPTPTIYHMMFHPKDNTPSLKVPYMVCLKKQSKPSQEHEKSYKERLKARKVKQITTFFNQKDKAYIIKYTPQRNLHTKK
ncbi:hypothetical protein [Cardinium endosymbiont of Dermatophagoides farinae]|uniref:hypothetical protein n=1 Tax=Cardinium endosymbiont of Dermatophagoides farinae TaxID=2597823 RepID=UPI001183A0DF|nr:hypothetical protein [Cardinium endosymbiont of Dermatophagoides farinae]TSJ80915.1 hypothetical protein FPG78_02595 [Cardinium endosymbiont of Dermatophagoides farinae]